MSKCNEDKWMKEITLDLPFQNKSYGLYTKKNLLKKSKQMMSLLRSGVN